MSIGETSSMSEKELEEQMIYLKKRLLTMEWDKSQNQLNMGMEPVLKQTRKELEETQQKISELRKAPEAQIAPEEKSV